MLLHPEFVLVRMISSFKVEAALSSSRTLALRMRKEGIALPAALIVSTAVKESLLPGWKDIGLFVFFHRCIAELSAAFHAADL